MSDSQRPISQSGARVHHTARPLDTAPSNTAFGDDAITAVHDSEALQGIEMTAARYSSANTKQDDPYLVCFGLDYDAEKYAHPHNKTISAARLTMTHRLKSKRLAHRKEVDSHRRSLSYRLQPYHGLNYHGSSLEHHCP